MNKNLYTRLLLAALLLAVALSPAAAADWLAFVADTVRVADVCIPGTHDAATGNGFLDGCRQEARLIATTQQQPIAGQWASGIRAFDIRPSVLTDGRGGQSLHVCHGRFATALSFDDVLRTLTDSLRAHPSEFAIVVVRHETDPGRDPEPWPRLMKETLERYADRLADFRGDLTVGQLRGKVLLLSRDNYDGPLRGGTVSGWAHGADLPVARITHGADSASLLLQDFYDTSQPLALATKEEAMWRLLRIRQTYRGEAPLWAINHTSGYARTIEAEGVGEVSTSDGYRLNAEATNLYLSQVLGANAGPVGIVMMDFAATDTSEGYAVNGLTLTQAVIAQNFR